MEQECGEKTREIIEETAGFFRNIGRYRSTGWRNKWILKAARGRVLDLGAGPGFYLWDLKAYGRVDNVVLLDLIYDAEWFKPELDEETIIVKGDMLSPPFKASSFDTVLMLASLHHIPYRECRLLVLRNVAKLLRSGGILVLTVWSPLEFKMPLEKRGDGFMLSSRDGKRFYYFYTLDELLKDVGEAGFTILERRYFIENPGKPSLTRNILVVAEKQATFQG
ncbi:Methyltransferase type 12 [Desulfurococcus amylolyticus 1221n]|uniref:Methyltransferase type 12 n=1 Tax=Desulfurococcus amylolyticus (strain DSM 18924 / JCM 16383 / VKM B-2413 / 1221n) TaxID=490899 RepID=B8D4A4_DESA1|nr:class I SAM-dependent methyltransferase [Desulfurococcus amylolyticus]ACL10935.1 Methyltransferase type 12 [Desulfurococcus amylolyticus 1221n]